jgi:septum formation protein
MIWQPETSGGFVIRERLVLASASPRRQAFLRQMGLDFEVRAVEIDEEPRPGETPSGLAERLALEKAGVEAARDPAAFVLAADTVVASESALLGKPRDSAEATAMLMRLSGRTHEVWTGFVLCHGGRILEHRAVRTEVTFIILNDALCRAYVLTGEPLDKAGAYGIQGVGGFLVERICGSYSNVVGLPLAEVMAALLTHGVAAPRI